MSFSSENGYVPVSIETIMLSFMDNINIQFGTSYTYETFVGTNFYKYFYAAAQRMQENEVKTSEIFLKVQDYFRITNERIQRPVATNPGLIEAFEAFDYVASVKPTIDADAGKAYICVDVSKGVRASGTVTITDYAKLLTGAADTITIGATVFTAQAGAATLGTATFQAATSVTATALSLSKQINAHATAGALVRATISAGVVTVKSIYGGTAGNAVALAYTNNDANVGATVSGAFLTGGTDDSGYAAKKLEINTIIKDSVAAGIVTQGSETTSIVLSNGQSFDFKFNVPNRFTTLLRLTNTLSLNNQLVVLPPDEVKAILFSNIQSRYKLGLNFEPQRYFELSDAPWASNVLLEWSIDNGVTWNSTIRTSAYNELLEILLANITVIEA